jgi:hypothetical protein
MKAFGSVRSADGWHSSSKLPESIDVLFISHLLNKDQVGCLNDFYFGTIPEQLQKKKISCATILLDHTGLNIYRISEKWEVGHSPRIIFNGVLSLIEELKIRKQLRNESRRLKKVARDSTNNLERSIYSQAALQAMGTFSIENFRLYLQVNRLIKKLQPKTLIVTYEGHAWERLAFCAARESNENIRCIGYQHTIIFKHQHSITRLLGKKYDPDLILTAGDSLAELMSERMALRSVPIKIGGTHRSVEVKNVMSEVSADNLPMACLVLPDGTMEECITIFNFAIEAAKLCPKIRYIFRMHPVLSFNKVRAQDINLNNLPFNIVISNNSIEDDFSSSAWALYRGTSAVIYSVIAGLRPIYLSTPGEIPIDPLFKLDAWKKVVKTPMQLIQQIEEDLTANKVNYHQEATEARHYCKKYFTPINFKAFLDEISWQPKI